MSIPSWHVRGWTVLNLRRLHHRKSLLFKRKSATMEQLVQAEKVPRSLVLFRSLCDGW